MKKLSLLCAILSLLLLLSACAPEQTPANTDTTEVPQTTAPETAPPTVLANNGQGAYTLIRSEESDADFITLASTFRETLVACTGASFELKTDFYNTWMEEAVFPNPEILLGETNRPESTEVLESLPDNSYAITRRGNKLVIIGTEPRLTEMALQHFTEQILSNPEQCGGGNLLFTDTDDVIITLEVSHVFICSSEAPENIVQSIEAAQELLPHFPLKTDADASSAYPEILIGETNRQESIDVLASLPANSYTIIQKGNAIVIIGTEPNLTVMALQHFARTILQSPDHLHEGKLIFTNADETTVTLDAKPDVADLLSNGLSVYAESIPVMSAGSYSDSIRISQGAASDGTYVYFVIRHTDDAGAVVYKHRLDTGEQVACSAVLQLGHGNDATFDTKNNRLIVAHGQSEGKILTLIDPDTLTVIEDIDIPAGSGAISYSTEKDIYAISQGGSTLHFLDANFGLIKSYSRAKNATYTAQGMGSDEDYLYFPMSGSKDNILEVYDWDGNYVSTIHVRNSFEAESVFWVNGTYYIAYYSGSKATCATLHQLDFFAIYEG